MANLFDDVLHASPAAAPSPAPTAPQASPAAAPQARPNLFDDVLKTAAPPVSGGATQGGVAAGVPAAPQPGFLGQLAGGINSVYNFMNKNDPTQAFGANLLDSATLGASTKAIALLDSGISQLISPQPSLADVVAGHTGGGPRTYEQSLQMVQGDMQEQQAAHPYAAAAGSLGGSLLLGSGVAKGLEATAAQGLPYISRVAQAATDLMTPVAGEGVVKTAGRMAGTGAAFGGADAAARGGNLTDIRAGAEYGAILGPVAGLGLSKVLQLGAKGLNMFGALSGARPVLDPVASASNVAFANHLKTLDPAAAEAIMNNLAAKTGLGSNVMMTADPVTGASIQTLAAANPILATRLQAANDQLQGKIPEMLAGKVEDVAGPSNPPQPAPQPPAPPPGSLTVPGQPIPGQTPLAGIQRVPGMDRMGTQDNNSLDTYRSNTMTAALDPIRHAPVTIDPNNIDIFKDRDIQGFMRAGLDSTTYSALMNRLRSVVDTGQPTQIPLSVLEDIRLMASRAVKGSNPVLDAKIGKLRDEVEGIGASQIPEYGAALDQYRQHSDYIRGFEHGQTGGTPGSASTPDVQASLRTSDGLAGHAAGITANLSKAANASDASALRTTDFLTQNAATVHAAQQAWGVQKTNDLIDAAQALKTAVQNSNSATPSRVTPAKPFPVRQGAAAIAEGVSGQPYSATRSFAKMMEGVIGTGKLAPAVQERLALMLTDPKQFTQGMAVLKAARVSDRDIGLLRSILSGIAGAQTSATLVPVGR